jgi:hypothetical protein
MPDTSGQTQALSGKNAATKLDDWKKKWRVSKASRERFIPEWYMNLAFYHGHQWLWWNRGRLAMPNLAEWRETPVDNRILPICSARVARKVKNRPIFVVTPNTGDESDIDAAKIGERVLTSDWLGQNLQAKLFQAQLLAEITGAGFWKIYWDATRGESAEYLFDAEGNPVIGQDGHPMRGDAIAELPPGITKKRISEGDVCVDVLSPFELFPDPAATSLDECEWMIEEKVRSAEYVKRRFGETMEPDTEVPIGPLDSRMAPSLVYHGDTGGAANTYKGLKVYEGWMRPCTEYPEGKHVVWCNEKLLEDENKPFDPMPYVMFSGIRSPNRFWPTSLVTQMRGPQTALNKIQGQIMENAKRLGNLSIMKSRQANVSYTGLPGEEVLYDSTVTDAVPSFLTPPEMPAYVREQVERIENSLTEISGLHEVSKATVPTGVTAASAINLLQEADDTRIGPEIQDMENGLAQAGSKVLKLRARFNTDERTIQIAGEDGNWDIFSFRAELLKDNTNVEVQAGSAMPRSKAAKQAAMLEVLSLAFQYGLEFDPRDLRKFFKDYEVAALERLFDSTSQDEQQAQRENRLLSKGEPVAPHPRDDHDIHIAAHDEYRKSGKFTRLPANAQQLIELHITAHQEAQVQAVNAQMSAMATEGQQQQQMALEASVAEQQAKPNAASG